MGAKGIWLSPIFESPLVDFGYDISDYTAILHTMGSMADFDEMMDSAHSIDLKVILDLVPNHTSEQHPWFVDSRSSLDSEKRDWYLWHDPGLDGGPPNNWQSSFGGSAWELDKLTGQYYYHAFMKEQPDLNWRNPEVRSAMFEIMRFWLDKGVDGFRVDVMWHLIKDSLFRDNPPNPLYIPGQPPHNMLLPVFSANHPEVHEVVSMMRAVIDEYDDRLLLGELYLPVNKIADYYGMDGTGAHLPMNCLLVVQDWKAPWVYADICEYEGSLPPHAWPNWVIGNHDRSRVASRLGIDQARVAALLLLTLRGTPIIYYGEEIGMEDTCVPTSALRDQSGEKRDPQRSPMQWGDGLNGGFTSGKPWLPLNVKCSDCNVSAEKANPSSMLSLYRRLIELRNKERALQTGNFTPLCIAGDAFAFIRGDCEEKCFLIAVNLNSHSATIKIPSRFQIEGEVVMSSKEGRDGERIENVIPLLGNEGLIALLNHPIVSRNSEGL